jgi:hypothetical protein
MGCQENVKKMSKDLSDASDSTMPIHKLHSLSCKPLYLQGASLGEAEMEIHPMALYCTNDMH